MGVLGPAVQAASLLTHIGEEIADVFSGCGGSCVVASDYANRAENLLRANLDAYMGTSVRTVSIQAIALNNFDTIWRGLLNACNKVGGSAGARCVSDREAGSCAYHNENGCWNWFIGYRDPIAKDPNVVPDGSPGAGDAASIFGDVISSAGGSPVQVTQQMTQQTSGTGSTGTASASFGQISTFVNKNIVPIMVIFGLAAVALILREVNQ